MNNIPKDIKIHSGGEIDKLPLCDVGGKAKGLAFLLNKGLKIPAFYVIVHKDVKELIDHPHRLRQALLTWESAYNISSKDLWAVRSSAANEDGHEKSFAGQFTSVLNLKKEELAEGINTVVDSYNRATNYAEKSDSFGVIIQKMVQPSYSGVFFSRDPILHYSDQPVISIIPGIGEKLVSGELDGYLIHFKNNVPVFHNEDEIVGENFEKGKRNIISSSSAEIKEALQFHIPMMRSVANEMEQVQDCALDFEFAIQDGEFFWLQVRPITTRSLHPTVQVWDNTSVEANYPKTTLPLSISFIQKTFEKAYCGGAKAVGFKKDVLQQNRYLFANMAGAIDGALYYNVTAWQTLIYQMPFGSRLCNKLPALWGMESIDFEKPKTSHTRFNKLKILLNILLKIKNGKGYKQDYLKMFHQHIECFELKSIQGDTSEELIAKYKKIEDELGNNWLAPVLNGFNTMVLFTLLKRKVRRSKIGVDYPNFINDILFSEGDVKSVQLVRRFQEIIKTIYYSDQLKTYFLENDATTIWTNISSKFKAFHTELCTYINEFGNRTDQGELKLETVNYKQDPTLFIQYIQSNLKGFRPTERSTEGFDYPSIIRKYYPINRFKRWWFNHLISGTIKRIKARENYRFMRTDTFAVIRILFLQMGEVLQKEGYIDHVRDVLYLQMEELFDLTLKNEFKSIIEKQKQAYLGYEKKKRNKRYMKVGKAYFGIHQEEFVLEGNEIKGTACCSGIVTNKVIVIHEQTDFNQDFSGVILVAGYFEPGWINLFYQADGIISERGNLLSHTAIICRELNLPSIVGAKGILKKLKTGDTVTMDGERGIIKIHEDE